MKKVFSILLVLAMLVCFMATSAFAADGGVSGSGATAVTGEQATVSFNVTGSAFCSYKLYVNYDASKLSNPSVSGGVTSNTGTPGQIVITYGSPENVTSSSFSITFTVNGDCSAPHTVSASFVEFYAFDENANAVQLSGSNGSATITVNHNYVAGEPVAADCVNGGYTLYTCSVCGASYKADETPALGHDFSVEVEKAVAPTCTEPGKTAVMKCSRCDVTTGGDEIPALGHTEEVIPAVAATCTTTGLTEGKKCSVCGEILVPQQEIPALGHNYQSVVTAPTCTEEGYTTYTCLNGCGHSYKDDFVPALGHKLAYKCGGKWGKHTEYCENGCGHELEENCFDTDGDKKCDACGCEKPADPTKPSGDPDDVPKTGDITPYGTYLLVAMMAVVAVSFGLKRKFDI